MPILNNSSYHPTGIFKNGHVNTMFPFLFRSKMKPEFKRERLTTPDLDFMDVDVLRNGYKKVLFLFHGLEGSSDSQYMKGTSSLFNENGFDVIATNYRGCSGEMNKHPYAYNSGATEDVDFIINQYIEHYDEAVIAGYSLGGNLSLKYGADGRFPLNPKIKAIMAVSTPIDLYGCVLEISKRKNFLYEQNFLRSLIEKTLEKAKVFPEALDADRIKKIKKLHEFDDIVTGPIHGYTGAQDYYDKCSSLQFLEHTHIPTLLLTAIDDPFLSDSCYPVELAKNHTYFNLLQPKHGGHCGFYTKGKSYYWNELELLTFAQTQTKS